MNAGTNPARRQCNRRALSRYLLPFLVVCLIGFDMPGAFVSTPPVSAQDETPDAPDDFEPDQQLITDVRSYAQETSNGYDHVLRWMRVLKTLGALDDMTAAEAQGNAGTYWRERWDPVVAELRELGTPGTTSRPTDNWSPTFGAMRRRPATDTSTCCAG